MDFNLHQFSPTDIQIFCDSINSVFTLFSWSSSFDLLENETVKRRHEELIQQEVCCIITKFLFNDIIFLYGKLEYNRVCRINIT